MRVGLNALFLVPGSGAVEVYTRRLVAALAAEAPRDDFVLYLAREAAGTFRLPANVREVQCDVAASTIAAVLAYEQLKLPQLALADRIDVLHSLGSTAPLLAERPSVVSIHDLHPDETSRAAQWSTRVRIARAAKHAARVIAMSNTARDALRKILQVSGERIDAVYPGADGNLAEASASTRRAVRARFELAGRFVLAVAGAQSRANLRGLLAGYERACIAWSDPPPLVVLGAREATLPARGRVVLAGDVEEAVLAGLYREAHAFVHPAFEDPFGFGVLAALSAGVPVIASASGALPELVGDAAVTFDPNDHGAMSGGLQRICDDEALRADLSLRGRERAKKFTWARCARQTLAVYRSATL